MRNLKYNYRLYPTKEQETLLNQFSGSQRWIWNHFLRLENNKTKKFRFSHKNITSLPVLKSKIETEWLKDISSASLQQTLIYLETRRFNS